MQNSPTRLQGARYGCASSPPFPRPPAPARSCVARTQRRIPAQRLGLGCASGARMTDVSATCPQGAAGQPAFCEDKWCYVDPATCAINKRTCEEAGARPGCKRCFIFAQCTGAHGMPVNRGREGRICGPCLSLPQPLQVCCARVRGRGLVFQVRQLSIAACSLALVSITRCYHSG